ncbi:MAG: ABC transporter substrate-binding protein [Anaerolineales bacterium]|nr:ABC transporter substrate-binding protein [Anaerolineales bacterium]
MANRAFAETLWFVIRDELQRLGVDSLATFTFTSEETDLQALAAEIVAQDPDAIVFVSSDIDTALLAQHIRQLDSEVPLFSSGWAQTNELLAKGGSAVEGLEIVALYNLGNEAANFLEFRKRFEERYNRPPGFGSAYAYEAVLLLAEGLKKVNGNFENLPDALANLETVEGVQGPLSIDRFGDVNRPVFMAVIEAGEYTIIEEVSFTE